MVKSVILSKPTHLFNITAGALQSFLAHILKNTLFEGKEYVSQQDLMKSGLFPRANPADSNYMYNACSDAWSQFGIISKNGVFTLLSEVNMFFGSNNKLLPEIRLEIDKILHGSDSIRRNPNMRCPHLWNIVVRRDEIIQAILEEEAPNPYFLKNEEDVTSFLESKYKMKVSKHTISLIRSIIKQLNGRKSSRKKDETQIMTQLHSKGQIDALHPLIKKMVVERVNTMTLSELMDTIKTYTPEDYTHVEKLLKARILKILGVH